MICGSYTSRIAVEIAADASTYVTILNIYNLLEYCKDRQVENHIH